MSIEPPALVCGSSGGAMHHMIIVIDASEGFCVCPSPPGVVPCRCGGFSRRVYFAGNVAGTREGRCYVVHSEPNDSIDAVGGACGLGVGVQGLILREHTSRSVEVRKGFPRCCACCVCCTAVLHNFGCVVPLISGWPNTVYCREFVVKQVEGILLRKGGLAVAACAQRSQNVVPWFKELGLKCC